MMNIRFAGGPYAAAAALKFSATQPGQSGQHGQYGFLNTQLVQDLEQAYLERPGYDVVDSTIFNKELQSKLHKQGHITKRQLQLLSLWMFLDDSNIKKLDDAKIKIHSKAAFQKLLGGEPNQAIAHLRNIEGVGTDMASLVLAVFDPDEYAPLSGRNLAVLEKLDEQLPILGDDPIPLKNYRPPNMDVKKYIDEDRYVYGRYKRIMQKLANELEVPLQTLDHALWILNRKTPQEAGWSS